MPTPTCRVLESEPVPDGRMAAAYDQLVQRHFWVMNRPFLSMILSRTPDRAGMKVLDIGTGPGLIPIELARKRPFWEITGLDRAQSMVEIARRHAARSRVQGRVTFRRGCSENLPFESGSFDLVISNFTLHHIERPERLFNEVQRILRPGGSTLIKDMRRPVGWRARIQLGFVKYVMRCSSQQAAMYSESMRAALSWGEIHSALKRSQLQGVSLRGFRGLDFLIEAWKERSPLPSGRLDLVS